MRPPPVPSDDVLPASYGFTLAGTTTVCDGGRTLHPGAGSVLRLAPVAADLVAAGPTGCTTPTARLLARRLLDADAAVPWWPDPAPPDDVVDDVTVVVPVRDRADRLARLLAALPPVPVVVVDDGSRDPAAVARVARAHGARCVVLPANLGPAAARNRGLAAATTPYVAFCDSDVVPDPGWLATLRRHLDDPALAVVAPRVLGAPPSTGDGWLDRYEQARSSLDLGPDPALVRVHGRVAYLPAACLLVRVSALGDGFDPALRCGEDVDLVWRLLGAGWRVRYAPEATVRHDHRTTPGAWLARKAFYGTSAAPLAARHGEAVAPLVLSPLTAAVALALLVQRRRAWLAAAAVGAATTAAAARRLGGGAASWRTAAVLTLEGAVAGGWQAGAALTRHYWPLALPAAVASRRVRRAVLVAGVGDALADRRRVGADLDPVRYVVARRLDDLGYGAGLWWGALRARSGAALRPAVTGLPRRRRTR